MESLKQQIGGNHYKNMNIQPLEFIMANKLAYCEANIIKYVCRYKSKNGLQDLLKAKHYLDILIEQYETRLEELIEDKQNEQYKGGCQRRTESRDSEERSGTGNTIPTT